MPDVKISELTLNASPSASDVVAASRFDSSVTNKVTLEGVAKNFSRPTAVAGSAQVTNMVSMTQTAYNSLSTYDASTLYVIEG